MTKGRPPLKPKIDALEAAVAVLTKEVAELRILVAQLAMSQKEAAPFTYQPLFERWPGNKSGAPDGR